MAGMDGHLGDLEVLVGARQLVRQDGGSGGPFYGAQPLQPTQTRAPTGERLRLYCTNSLQTITEIIGRTLVKLTDIPH